MEKLLQEAQSLLQIRLTPRQVALLKRYEEELLEWNTRMNLTAIRDVAGIRIKHFLDSFTCSLAWRDRPPESLIDIGTGAGFPGIPLKILYPTMRLTLVDSIGKKVEFCRHIVETLGLENVEVIQARAEELGQNRVYREHFEWAVARAVAQMNVLAEYLLPLVRVGGAALAQKGESAPAEAHASENAIRLLGGRLRQLVPVTLPGVAEERFLIIIDKIAATPQNYPRRVGVPARNPLR
ncbi:16S rRNA m(7)G-527 methyltransferase [Anaerolinea thermolimosa]|uniref:16S rRNA (guanine(527)-N(7))-methyltransferase RsmG n=1 Tax=Anaerolinea thermolimosa TaxID=229919 RepID=UPI0007863775|nr:16S rRNA (guanine(527)-N(7))-methyltransferase RsmG [Anaerolinea thermolimosa]GAP05499.1 16S rRNA m(7)G-527 methyltransferase [Anaerolinea thermolimosa]